MDIIKEYMDFDTNGGGTFHPSHDKIAFISDRFGFHQLMELDLRSGKERRLLTTDNRCTNPIYLQDGTLVFSSDKGGDEHFQLFALDKGELIHLTKHPGVKFRFEFDTETHIYFSANLTESQRFDVYRMAIPLKNSEMELVCKGFDYMPLSPKVISEDGKLILVKAVGNLWNEMYIYDGDLKSITSEYTEKKARFNPVTFLDKNTLLITTDLERDFLNLALFDIISHNIHYLEDTEWDTSSVVYKDSILYYLKNEDGSSALYRGNLADNKLSDIEKIPSPAEMGVFTSGDFRSFTKSYDVKDGKILATFSSSTDPSNVWLYENDWTQLTGNDKDYSRYSFVTPTLERFASFDGLIIPYFFYKSGINRPTILMIHGGPEGMYRPSFSKIVQMFVRLGFNVAAPNIRGSNGYGRLYLSLDDIEKRLDSIADIKELADHLETKNEVDGSRLVVYGGSYGGYAVLASITGYPERYAAAVDIVGISDLYTFLKNTAPWRRRIREVEYGFLDRDAEVLRKVSPIHKVDSIITPLLIIQGDNDERVPLSESIQIHEKVSSKGIKCELLRFADEGHGVTKRKNQIIQFEKTLEFLSEVLKINYET